VNDQSFIDDYLNRYKESLAQTDSEKLIQAKEILLGARDKGSKVILAGNGGSASMASHVAVDLTKQAGVRAVNYNEADLITCFANDYGYEHWVGKAIEFYGDEGDVVILISSSGSSQNMVNAVKSAKKLGMRVITFTGFNEDNLLKQGGDLNLWVNSSAYNVVENTHQMWLLLVCDLIIGNAEYPS
jgi:D-sedoheptulose 7-phosphate isomerase|tara:strand:+ start:501 stop:1058 length:558 start_codon:yes stop_codon:yes gene_type:complete